MTQRRGGTILIVDDQPTNLGVLFECLSSAGFKVLVAQDGESAVAQADRARPDLILLDILMPGLDGYQTCQRLKASAATCRIPVIFMTALSQVQDKVRAFEAGGVDYVTKPFQHEEVLARVQTHLTLQQLQQELREQNTRLQREIEAHQRTQATVRYLSEELRTAHHGEIIGHSEAMQKVLEQVTLVAGTDSTVLIQGGTGTGKELIARAIHDRSSRRERPLIKLNCAALPRELIESELFGHEKGAFTGATQQRKGRFELAHGGTLFLDEVGELPIEAQAKLLRVLQEQEFERVGGSKTLHVDVRVIAATNHDLDALVQEGRFRPDLYYRLNVFPITVPPLRERRADIPLLAEHQLARLASRLGKPFTGIAPQAMEQLLRYSWPGNIRELQNVIERAAILSPGPLLEIDTLKPAAQTNLQTPAGTLEEVERNHILQVLEDTGWTISGEHGAAAVLGLHPSTLRSRMHKLGIRKSG